MKRWVRNTLWSLAGVGVLACGAVAWGIWYLNPVRHFSATPRPVLSRPSTPPVAATPNGAQTTTQPDAKQQQAEQTEQTQQAQTSSFNVLILGVDARSDEASRSDVILVAHVNPQNKTVNLVSVPRDTRVNLPGVGLTKINHAHFLGNLQDGNHGGTAEEMNAVSQFLGVEINYYIKTNFEGFQHVIDSIGGIDVDFQHPVGAIPAGMHHLNGEEALTAVRERDSLPNGDIGREADQATLLKAVLQKELQPANLPHLPALYQEIRQDLIDTNFTDRDLISLGLLLKGIDSSQIHYVQIPGQGGVAYDPLVKMDLDYWIPDLQAVQQISKTYLHDPS